MTNFSINFVNSYYLLLLIPALILTLLPYFRLAKKYRRTRNRIVSIVLHLIIMVLAVSVLAGISFSYDKPNTENEVILLVDVSFSGEENEQDKNEFVKDVIDYSGDMFKVGVVTFGYDQVYAAELTNKTDGVYEKYLKAKLPNTTATNIADALTFASEQFKSPSTARIVLITDGIQTDGKAETVIRYIAQKGIKVDTMFFPDSYGDELRIVNVEKPNESIKTNIPVPLTVTLQSSYTGVASITVKDEMGNSYYTENTVQENFQNGEQVFTIDHTFGLPGLHKLCVEIESSGDTITQNNKFYTYIDVPEFDDILIVERKAGDSDGLVNMLSDELDIDIANIDPEFVASNEHVKLPVTLDGLRKYDEVILVNIAHEDMPEGFEEAIYTYVTEIGGGLLTVGGNGDEVDEKGNPVANTYVRDDLYGTKYQELLPVEAIEYTPPVAVMIIVDCSGSMSESDGNQTKLQAAKQGALSCLGALSERDYVGIMTFSDWYNEEATVTPRTHEAAIVEAINNIREKADGGTIFATALERAGRALASVKVERRHIIIVTDGQPSDPYEVYGPWIKSNYENYGITMSVVAIGASSSDRDNMVQAVSLAGGTAENYHEVASISQAPEVMRKDLEAPEIKEANYETFRPTIEEHNSVVSGIDEESIPTLDGFYGTKIKSGASVILKGEYVPIYAQWKIGKGVVGSFMCDLNGIWSADFIKDKETGYVLVNNMVEALFPIESIEVPEMNVKITEDNYTSTLNVYNDIAEDEKIELYVTSPESDYNPEEITQEYKPTKEDGYRIINFTVMTPGVHELNVVQSKEDGTTVHDIIAYKAFSYSKEYNPFVSVKDCEVFMTELAEAGGGMVIEEAYDVFKNVAKYIHKVIDPRLIFMIIAIVLFLLDVAVRKFKFKWPHEIIRDQRAKRDLKKN